jgi:hypothetical protein
LRWASLPHHTLSSMIFGLLSGQSNGAQWPYIETSDPMSQSKSFLSFFPDWTPD